MSAIEELLGQKVVKQDGSQVDVSSLCGAGKLLGLYFSAHWCPPCRGFTPVLSKFYTSLKASDKADQLEIVFISSDRDPESMRNYFAEMPWLALPYEDRATKDKLSNKFGVRGIPTFILLDADTGEVYNADGRALVLADQEAKNFPWK